MIREILLYALITFTVAFLTVYAHEPADGGILTEIQQSFAEATR